MPFYLYRENGGEVLVASTETISASDPTMRVFESVTTYDLSEGYFCDGSTLRLATTSEKARWENSQKKDEKDAQKKSAELFLEDSDDCSPTMRSLRAILVVLLQEINLLRSEIKLPRLVLADVVRKIREEIAEPRDL